MPELGVLERCSQCSSVAYSFDVNFIIKERRRMVEMARVELMVGCRL